MNRMSTKILVVLLLAVLVGAGVYLGLPLFRKAGATPGDNKSVTTVKGIPDGDTTAAGKALRPPRTGPGSNSIAATGAEQAAAGVVSGATGTVSAVEVTLERIDELLSDDREDDAFELIKSLMNHPDPEVRMEAAELFGWIGLKALTELSLMLKDKNPEVASTALHNWELTIDEITDDSLKAEIAIEGIKVLKNQDDVEGMLLLFDSMEESVGVRSIVNIIQNGTPVASELAREHYEFMTEEPYTTPEAAEAWLKKQAE